MCPCCNVHPETFAHLFACSDPTRETWRQDVKTELVRRSHRFHVPDSIMSVLNEGLDSCFLDVPMKNDTFPAYYQTLLTHQNKIGWSHLVQGHLSTEWARVLNRYLRQQKLWTEEINGENWCRSILSSLFTATLDLWQQRNELVHGIEWSQQQQRKKARCQQEIIQLHHLRPQMQPKDHYMLLGSEDHEIDTFCENKTASYLSNWLQTWRPSIRHSVKQAKRASIANVKAIYEYFRPPNSDSPKNDPEIERGRQSLPAPVFDQCGPIITRWGSSHLAVLVVRVLVVLENGTANDDGRLPVRSANDFALVEVLDGNVIDVVRVH